MPATLALMTVGGAGVSVVPVVQANVGVARADAALRCALLVVGLGLGGVLISGWPTALVWRCRCA